MPQFSYKVRDGHGELLSGIIRAASLEEAGNLLRVQGKFIVKIDPTRQPKGTGDTQRVVVGGKRIKRSDVIIFSHQLAVMVDTGVPIDEALECITKQTDDESFRAVLENITHRVNDGGTLSAALGAYPKVFPAVMTSLLCASEASGTMGVMLDRISSYLQKEEPTAKNIRGALLYPAVMFVLVVMVTGFLLTFVLPRFASIYQSKHASLPVATRALMGLSDLLIGYWWAWLGGAVLGVFFVMFSMRTSTGRRAADYLKLHLPLLRSLYTKMYLTRACRTMATMLTAGVPILDMIGIVRKITNNYWYEDLWDAVDQKLQRGLQLSDALFTSPLISRSVAQMVYSGEKSG
jgi:type IV pilus assembly protein PilC